MARSSNQKLKLLYLMQIFMTDTDEDHGLTMREIIAKLGQYDISADRKTLYQDFEELRQFGLDIIAEQAGKVFYYKLVSRDFELPELKLLVDSVQSAKFITERKSKELIRKLEGLASKYEAKQLTRQVIISGRVKTMNESIYYNVDKIHTAIATNSQILFQYAQWTMDKELMPRRNGEWYQISPWSLAWDDEYYYLIAFDEADAMIKHYRVDKMQKIAILDLARNGRDEYAAKNVPSYAKRLFGMFGGETEIVTIEAENDLVGVFIDRFGKDIPLHKVDQDHFSISVDVEVSPQFLGWIIALGEQVKITAPADVVKKMQDEARRLAKQYLK
ncbi:MAG: WYL domain-containing protein [Lachnospiraceae bacterium]|nr:WYL domain-containing protein [Lachnospiraceae bacterium]